MVRILSEGESPLINLGKPRRKGDKPGKDPWGEDLVVKGGVPDNFAPREESLTTVSPRSLRSQSIEPNETPSQDDLLEAAKKARELQKKPIR